MIKTFFPEISPGNTVKIYQRIKEGDKTRIQVFEGLVIARKHGSEAGATITVRKMSGGMGVERIFPLALPTLEKIEVVKKTKVRRAKLYYIRQKSAKEARKKLRSQLQIGTVASVEEKASEEKKEIEE